MIHLKGCFHELFSVTVQGSLNVNALVFKNHEIPEGSWTFSCHCTPLVALVFLAAVHQKLTFREFLVLSNGCQPKVGVVAGEVPRHFWHALGQGTKSLNAQSACSLLTLTPFCLSLDMHVFIMHYIPEHCMYLGSNKQLILRLRIHGSILYMKCVSNPNLRGCSGVYNS